jgi:molybdopterin-biosynthesis enzyme MoeA-like protein
LHLDGRHVWVFPGVPGELEWMLATYMVPWLERTIGARTRHRRVLKIAGMGESGLFLMDKDMAARVYVQAAPLAAANV